MGPEVEHVSLMLGEGPLQVLKHPRSPSHSSIQQYHLRDGDEV